MTKFDWRLLDKSQCYDELVEWWEAHQAFEGRIIEYSSMPHRVFVVSKNGIDLYAVAVYVTDSDLCWIGWITSNPNSPLKLRAGALDFLYSIIAIVMKAQGFNQIISKTNNRGLKRVLESNAFVLAENANFYVKK